MHVYLKQIFFEQWIAYKLIISVSLYPTINTWPMNFPELPLDTEMKLLLRIYWITDHSRLTVLDHWFSKQQLLEASSVVVKILHWELSKYLIYSEISLQTAYYMMALRKDVVKESF